MPTIPNYTKTVTVQRAVANTVDPSAIQRAAEPLQQLGQVLGQSQDIGFAIAEKEKQMQDTVDLNNGVVSYKKDLLDLDTRLRSENQMTPQGYSGLYEQESKKLKQKYSERFKGENQIAFNTTADNVNLSGYERALTWQRTQGVEVARHKTNEAFEMVYDRQYNGGSLEEAFNDIDATIVSASTIVDDQIALENLRSGARERAVMSSVNGALSRNQLSAAQSIIDNNDADLGAQERDRLTNKVKATRKSLQVEQRRRENEAIAAVNTYESRMSEGFDIPAQEMEYIEGVVNQSGSARVRAELDNLKNVQEITQQFKKLSPVELESVIQQEILPATKNDGATDYEAKLLKMSTDILGKMETAVKSDPLEYAATVGNTLPALDIKNPASITDRAIFGQSVAEKYGTDIKVLTKNEASQLSKITREANEVEQMQIIQTMSQAGKNALPMLAQMTDENPVFAHVAGLAHYQPNARDTIVQTLKGQKSLEERPDFKPPSGDIDLVFNNYVGDAYINAPKEAAALKQAALAHYIGSNKYDVLGVVKSRDFKESVDAVLGGEGRIGQRKKGTNYVLPTNVSEGDLEDFLDVISDETLNKIGTGVPRDTQGRKISAKEFEKHAALESVGHGLYRAKIDGQYILGDAPDGTFMMKLDEALIKGVLGKDK